MEEIVATVYKTAKPETWDIVGGYGTIQVGENDLSETFLEVSNTASAHLEVSRLLDDLRGAATGITDRSLVKELYEDGEGG